MTPFSNSATAAGPEPKVALREEPFGLSLSKPLARGAKAAFDKLSANGGGEPTLVNSRKRPQLAIGTAAFHASRLAHRVLGH